MDASLDEDIERVSSVLSQEANTTIRVTLNTTDGQTMHVTVHRGEAIYEAVARCLQCDDVEQIRYVQLGGVGVGVSGESVEEEEIEDGAKLDVCVVVTLSFEDVVDATVALNPNVTKKRLMNECSVDPDDPLQIIGNVNWANLGLRVLPDIISKLKIAGSLTLFNNKLQVLPETFAYISVSGNIGVSSNLLKHLPQDIGCLRIGGYFDCSDNQLSRLPDSIGDMQIGTGFSLYGNLLSSLPASFQHLALTQCKVVHLGKNKFEKPYPLCEGLELTFEESDSDDY